MTVIDAEVWADVRCPWCWVGLRRLYAAVREIEAQSGEPVRVAHRSFLLEPEGTTTPGLQLAEVAVAHWGMTGEQWAGTSERIRSAGRSEQLDIRIDTAVTVDSRTAHRLLKLATDLGVPPATSWDVIADAHLRRNRDISDPAVLVELGRELGLPGAAVDDLLSGERYAADVLADHHEARRRGIASVPSIVVGDRTLEGSRTVSELVDLLSPAEVRL